MANFIPEDKIAEIKNAADIVEIVSEAVLLKKAGKNYLGLCPFHSEKTPSFTVSTDKQIFYCFGCGTGGNVFSFIMKQEGLSFPEAVRKLASRYGIDIPIKSLSPELKRRVGEKESLLELNRQAMEFFQHALLNYPAGERARSYLEERKISRKTTDDFKLGYAPAGWDHLFNFFSRRRMAPELIAKSGLIIARKNNSGYYDRFRDRIMFPIFDERMQVVGFGGRVLDDALPKYLNSPETPVYNKGRSLYGIHRAKDKCRAADTVYIVEGYLDLLALHQNGIENTVATLGTALTEEHVRLLKRYASRMILVYDSDDAGIRSAQRCIEIFWKEHVDFRRQDVFREENADTRILVLPPGHDPDSYVSEFGPESFLAAASKSTGIITFLLYCAVKRHGLSTEGKIRIIADMQGPLAAINDRVAQSLYVKQLAERIDIDETAVLERIREISSEKSVRNARGDGPAISPGDSRGYPADSFSRMRDAGSRMERQILAMMLQFPDIISEVKSNNILELFENNTMKSIGQAIVEFGLTAADQVSELISQCDDRQVQTLIASLAMEDESWNLKGCLRLLAAFVEAQRKRHQGASLDDQIKAAENSNDQALLLKLLQEKHKMAVRSEKRKMAILKQK